MIFLIKIPMLYGEDVLEGKVLERFLSFVFMAAAGFLFFMFLGVALYIGLILCLALVAFVFITAGAEKAQEWWQANSPAIINWYRRMWAKFKNWGKPKEKHEVYEIDPDNVELLTPEEYDRRKKDGRNI